MQEKEYEHKSYISTAYTPRKNQITAAAMYHIKEFIKKSGVIKKMDDWLLTRRENQVIALMAEGLTNDEIATKLDISVNSVSSYITDIYTRYELEKGNRVLAVLTYFKRIGRLNEG